MHERGLRRRAPTFRNRFCKRRYEVAGQFAGIACRRHTGGDPAARRRSSVHYYQQPGDDLEVDSTRTSLVRPRGADQVRQVRRRHHALRDEPRAPVRRASRSNDLGYLRRADMHRLEHVGGAELPQARQGIYRWAQVNGNHWETWNTSGTRLENALNFNGHMGLNEQLGRPPRRHDRPAHGELLRPLHARRPALRSRADSSRGAASTPTAARRCPAACG